MLPIDILAISMSVLFLYMYAASKPMPGGNPILRKLPRGTLLISALLVLATLAVAYLESSTGGVTFLLFEPWFVPRIKHTYDEVRRP